MHILTYNHYATSRKQVYVETTAVETAAKLQLLPSSWISNTAFTVLLPFFYLPLWLIMWKSSFCFLINILQSNQMCGGGKVTKYGGEVTKCGEKRPNRGKVAMWKHLMSGFFGQNLVVAEPVQSKLALLWNHNICDCILAFYNVLGNNGKFWSSDGSQVMCSASQVGEATGFQLELLGNSRIAIKTAEGQYLRGENNGVLTATGSEVNKHFSVLLNLNWLVLFNVWPCSNTIIL